MLHFGTAALGSLIGGSIGIGPRTGWMLGNLVANQFAKKPALEGRRIEDLSVQTSTYGKPIPIIYGHALLKGNIIWSPGIHETCKITKQRVSLLQKVKVKDYNYTANLAIGLCEGETKGLQRIWANGNLIYDISPENAGKVKAFAFKMRFHTGSESQMPDPLIASKQADAPAFRGLSYVVFEDFPLTDFNNHVPRFTFEVTRDIAPTLPVIQVKDTDQEADNICFADVSPWLFLRAKNTITCINRDLNKIEEAFDLEDKIPKTDLFTSNLFGHLCFDEEAACLYAFAQHQLSSFIVKIDPLSGMIQADNFGTKIIGDEQIGFVDGQLFYTADFLKGIIRVYQKSDLSRLYEIPGAENSGLHLRPTNFTKDHQGRIWLASYNALDNHKCYLTRVCGQADVQHFTIDGYGQATGIVFDEVTKKIIVSSYQGLVIIDPDSGAVVNTMQTTQSYSLAFGGSGFRNHAVVQGKMWLAKDGEAIEVNLENLTIIRRVTSAQSFHGCTYDDVQQALWFKGGILSKLLLGRQGVQALKLPDVVGDLASRAGLDANELQLELKDKPVHGFIIPHPMRAVKALQPLQQAHFFYIRSHAGKINCFYPEDKAPIPVKLEDVGAHVERQKSAETLQREPATELPREVEVLYSSVERRFGVNTQKARLHGKPCSQVFRLELPLLMRDAEAQEFSKRLLTLAWQRRSSVIFTLPPRYAHLEVGDRLSIGSSSRADAVVKRGDLVTGDCHGAELLAMTSEILITAITHSPDGLIEIEGWIT